MQGGNESDINQEKQQSIVINKEHTALPDGSQDSAPPTRFIKQHPLFFISLIVSVLIFIIGLAWLLMPQNIDWQNPLTEDEPTMVKTIAVDFSIPLPSEEEVDGWVVESSLPRYMNIQSLNMTRARVESLGLKANTNQIDDPHYIWDVAWYNKSAKPGSDGVGIYSCHTFFSPGGLCDGLGNLPIGTEIKVERGDGVVLSYKIVENLTMTKEEANSYMAILFELPDVAGVRQAIAVITCAGNYDIYSGIASHRTMVRAILK